jgi:hypothetical protein
MPLGVSRNPAGKHDARDKEGRFPIDVKLAPQGVTDVRATFSSGLGKAAMDATDCVQWARDIQTAKHRSQQPATAGIPHPPQRGDIRRRAGPQEVKTPAAGRPDTRG